MKTVSGPTDHVVVVGAGLSGLAAALHLLGAGRRVTVVEQGSGPGGRAGRVELGGYRIDTGPTVLTMPHLADEAFAAVGDSLHRRVELIPLHPAYRARFADGSLLDVHTDGDAMEAEVRRFAGAAEAAGYRRLRRWLERMYRAQMHRFIDTNFDSPFQLLHPDLARLAALGGFGRLDPQIGRFLSDPRLRRVFSFQALYAGVAPARALAAYAVIAYMDTVAGVWFPKGGMYALPRAMADAAAGAGGRVPLVGRGDRAGARRRAGTGRPAGLGRADPLRRGRPDTGSPRRPPASGPRTPTPRAAASRAVGRGPARRHGPHLARTGAPHALLRCRLGAHVRRTHPVGTGDE